MQTIPALPIYTETLGAALDATHAHFTARGYTFGDDWSSMNSPFATGGIPYETNKSATFPVTKTVRGKEKTFYVQVSIYRMDSGRYELTAYIG